MYIIKAYKKLTIKCMRKKTEINRRKYPYRGLLTAVGKVLGISPQAVGYALGRNSPDVITLYNKMLSKRMDGMDTYRKNQERLSDITK